MASMLHGLGLPVAKAPASCILQMAKYRAAIAYSHTAAHTKLMKTDSPQRLRPEGTPQAHRFRHRRGRSNAHGDIQWQDGFVLRNCRTGAGRGLRGYAFRWPRPVA